MNPERIKADARAALEECRGIAQKAYEEGRDLTGSESSRIDELRSKAKSMQSDLALRAKVDALGTVVDLRPRGSVTTKGLEPTPERFAVSTADLKQLHTAATGGMYARKTISTTQSPMSAVGHYDLTPIPYPRDKANPSPQSEHHHPGGVLLP